MMKKEITLSISSKDYVITIDDEQFARVLERDFGVFVGARKFLSVKELLDAYVGKCYEIYEDESIMKSTIKDINKSLKIKE